MLNRVILMGRLTADPELRQTPTGVSSCRFSVAIDRGYKSKDTGERQTDFIRITAWRSTAEFICRYFTKGRMIIVEGSLRNNDYTDQNGVKHYQTEVQADSVSFGESKSASYGDGIVNNSSFRQPSGNSNNANAAPAKSQPSDDAIQLGDLGDFEEILGDGEVPF